MAGRILGVVIPSERPETVGGKRRGDMQSAACRRRDKRYWNASTLYDELNFGSRTIV